MKKLVLLLGLFMILPLCKMQAWDMETYFGIKIGMSRTAAIAAIQKYVNKAKALPMKSERQGAVLDADVQYDFANVQQVDEAMVIAEGLAESVPNALSLMYPVAKGERVYFEDTVRLMFMDDKLVGVSCNMSVVKPTDKPIKSLSAIVKACSVVGYQKVGEGDTPSEFYGYSHAIVYQKGNKGLIICGYEPETIDNGDDGECTRKMFSVSIAMQDGY